MNHQDRLQIPWKDKTKEYRYINSTSPCQIPSEAPSEEFRKICQINSTEPSGQYPLNNDEKLTKYTSSVYSLYTCLRSYVHHMNIPVMFHLHAPMWLHKVKLKSFHLYFLRRSNWITQRQPSRVTWIINIVQDKIRFIWRFQYSYDFSSYLYYINQKI